MPRLSRVCGEVGEKQLSATSIRAEYRFYTSGDSSCSITAPRVSTWITLGVGSSPTGITASIRAQITLKRLRGAILVCDLHPKSRVNVGTCRVSRRWRRWRRWRTRGEQSGPLVQASVISGNSSCIKLNEVAKLRRFKWRTRT